ncbi:MAG: hypothetical protein ACYC9Y_01510 [Candidatus Methylomirabilia bacterium]
MKARTQATILLVLSILFAIGFSVTASGRNLTSLENVLLQFFTLAVGFIGSFILGKETARDAARQMIKPHARSAFRRLLSLYRSLSRLSVVIQESRASDPDGKNPTAVLDRIEGIVVEQISTADDALEDWQDIVPEDVSELRAKIKTLSKTENN